MANSIESNREILRRLVESGAIKPAPPAPSLAPIIPPPPSSAEPSANPYLRSPLPGLSVRDADSVRQFHNSAVPQVRIWPLPSAADPTAGAQAASQAQVIVDRAIAAIPPVADIDIITAVNIVGSGGSSFSTPAFVQAKKSDYSATSSISFSSNNTLGNLLIVCLSNGTGTSGVSDSQGNTYVQLFTDTTVNGLLQTAWYALNCKAGANTVTISNPGAGPGIIIAEYSGIATSGALDQFGKNASTASGTGSWTTPTLTTTQAKELLVAFEVHHDNYNDLINVPPFTTRGYLQSGGTAFSVLNDNIVSATGSYNDTQSLPAGLYVAVLATFKAAGIASFTFSASDNNKLVQFAGTITSATLPTNLPPGWQCVVSNNTSVNVTISSTAFINNSSSNLIVPPGSSTWVFFDSANFYTSTISGNISASQITSSLLALARGGTNADLSATGGTSQVLKQVSAGAAITVAQLAASDLSNGTTGTGAVVLAASPTLTGTLAAGSETLTGKVTNYNSIATLSNGVPAEYATVDLTAQAAAISATTLYAVPAAGAGMYRVSWVATVTQAATTSSTLGGAAGFQLVYTDNDDSVVKTTPASGAPSAGVNQAYSQTNQGNTTASQISGVVIVNAKASTNIQYQIGYTSVGGTPMQYSLHLKIEAL